MNSLQRPEHILYIPVDYIDLKNSDQLILAINRLIKYGVRQYFQYAYLPWVMLTSLRWHS